MEVLLCLCGDSSLFDWRSLAVCAGALLCLSGSTSLVEVGNVAGAARCCRCMDGFLARSFSVFVSFS